MINMKEWWPWRTGGRLWNMGCSICLINACGGKLRDVLEVFERFWRALRGNMSQLGTSTWWYRRYCQTIRAIGSQLWRWAGIVWGWLSASRGGKLQAVLGIVEVCWVALHGKGNKLTHRWDCVGVISKLVGQLRLICEAEERSYERIAWRISYCCHSATVVILWLNVLSHYGTYWQVV